MRAASNGAVAVNTGTGSFKLRCRNSIYTGIHMKMHHSAALWSTVVGRPQPVDVPVGVHTAPEPIKPIYRTIEEKVLNTSNVAIVSNGAMLPLKLLQFCAQSGGFSKLCTAEELCNRSGMRSGQPFNTDEQLPLS